MFLSRNKLLISRASWCWKDQLIYCSRQTAGNVLLMFADADVDNQFTAKVNLPEKKVLFSSGASLGNVRICILASLLRHPWFTQVTWTRLRGLRWTYFHDYYTFMTFCRLYNYEIRIRWSPYLKLLIGKNPSHGVDISCTVHGADHRHKQRGWNVKRLPRWRWYLWFPISPVIARQHVNMQKKKIPFISTIGCFLIHSHAAIGLVRRLHTRLFPWQSCARVRWLHATCFLPQPPSTSVAFEVHVLFVLLSSVFSHEMFQFLEACCFVVQCHRDLFKQFVLLYLWRKWLDISFFGKVCSLSLKGKSSIWTTLARLHGVLSSLRAKCCTWY